MPDYMNSGPAPLAFIVIPVVLVCLLAWGTATAWRRSGATQATATRAASFAVLAACLWMAASWTAAASGVLRE